MPATAPPPAAAPAAASVTAPPKPAAARPSIAPPPEKDSGEWMQDESLELDDLAQEKPRPAPKERARKKSEPEPEADTEKEPTTETESTLEAARERERKKGEKKEEAEPEAEAEPEDTKLDEAEPGEVETPVEEPAEPVTNRDLREAYKTGKTKLQEANNRLAKLEAELTTLKKNGTAPDVLTTELKSLKEENQALKGRLSENDYREHPDYQAKQGTFENEFNRARRNLGQMTVENKDGTTRKFSDDDLISLINLPFGQDRTEAQRLFGDSAEDALSYARRLRDMAEDQNAWVENNKKNAGKVAQEREAAARAEHIERAKTFEKVNTELADKFPHWFKPVEGDTDGNATLERGMALTKLMFNAGNLSQEEVKLLPKRFADDILANGKLSKENTIRLHALIRSKAMNHDRIARWMKKLRLELTETKKALAQYEASEPDIDPGRGTKRRAGGAVDIDDDMAELDRLSRQSR